MEEEVEAVENEEQRCLLDSRVSRAPLFYDWHDRTTAQLSLWPLPSASVNVFKRHLTSPLAARRSLLNGCHNNALFYYRMWDSLALALVLSLPLSLAVSLSVVWRASAVDRKILISPRFGACTFPRSPRHRSRQLSAEESQINCLAICNTFMAAFMCYTFHLDIDNLTVASAAMTMSTNHKRRGMRHNKNHQASTTATCLNVSHIESAIKHTKWLRESARVCIRGMGRGRGVRASIIHHKHFYGRSHLLSGPLCLRPPPLEPSNLRRFALLLCSKIR